MAMLDDPEWLLQHIKHCFVTSDDTGMCEMVLQDNDMMTLDQHRERIRKLKLEKKKERAKKKQKTGLPESFGQSTPAESPKEAAHNGLDNSPAGSISDDSDLADMSPIAPSPDIQSGWDFGGRRRSNTAQKLERIRKDKQNRVKVNSIPWRKKDHTIPEDDFNFMFQKKELDKNKRISKCEDTVDNDIRISECKTLPTGASLATNVKNCEEPVRHIGFNVETPVNEESRELLNGDSTSTLENIDLPFPSIRPSSSECSINEQTPNPSGFSVLSKLLDQSTEQYNNPFREYARFDAEGQSGQGIRKVNIFIWPHGAEKPVFSILIHVLAHKAKVQDVAGLACWKYSLENREPFLTGTVVQRYALHIAEDDDGTVDVDFPPLEANEPFLKFKFPSLTLVEKRPNVSNGHDAEKGVSETVFVKVNDHEGSSLIRVDNLDITMGEILKRTLARRKGKNYAGTYVLEYQDKVGEAVNPEQTLESTGVMEFHLVRQHSSRTRMPSDPRMQTNINITDLSSVREETYVFPPRPNPGVSEGFIFVPTTEYVVFRLNQIRKMRSAVPIDFGVGMHQIDVVPVERRESQRTFPNLLSPKPKSLTIRIGMLAYCGIHDPKIRSNSLSVSPQSSSGSFSSSLSSFPNNESSSGKSYEKTVFKIYYKLSKDHTDYKHLTLEGTSDDVADAVERVKKVMVLSGDRQLQSSFDTYKFGVIPSQSSSSSSTLKRRGSIFR